MRHVPNSSIGVVIADDSAPICKLIAQLLQGARSLHLVGVAGTLEETLYLAAEYTPDVLLLDLHLDGLLPQDPLRIKIGLLSCVRHVIAMSTRSDEQEQQLARSYGAVRLVDKFWLSPNNSSHQSWAAPSPSALSPRRAITTRTISHTASLPSEAQYQNKLVTSQLWTRLVRARLQRCYIVGSGEAALAADKHTQAG